MTTSDFYALGYSDGIERGEHDRREYPAGVHETTAEAREFARGYKHAESALVGLGRDPDGARKLRAEMLGFLRGYKATTQEERKL